VLTFELTGDDPSTGFRPGAGGYFSRSDFRAFALSATVPNQGPRSVRRLEYHEQPADRSAHMRLVEHVRTRYWDDAGDAAPPSEALPFGTHGPRGLKYEDYKLALTDQLLTAVFGDKLEWEVEGGTTARGHLDRPIGPNSPFLESGYILGSGIDAALSGQYWMRSGTAGFAPDAHEHFFLPEYFQDPFGNQTTLAYDALDLYIQSSRDALGNPVSVEAFDHRVLAPARLRDANDNLSAVAFDIRGLPVASALLGKVDATPTESGDTLDGVPFDQLNPSAADVKTFFEAQTLNDVQTRTWLGRATAHFVYHFGEERDANGLAVRWGATPAGACSLTREQHERDAPNDHPELGRDGIRLQVAFEYSDGGGQAFVKKVQAEPANDGGPLRWLTNGLTIVNNKGKPVLQYEPYFTGSDHRYQEPRAHGVSPVMYYDAPGRLVRTEFPDGTLSRVEFSPWFSRTFDPSDTVLQSRWYARRAQSTDPQDVRAARLSALHANTPAEMHADSLGRDVVGIAHNCSPDATNSNTPLDLRTWLHERYLTFTKLDAEGKPLWICDARGNRVMQYVTPPLSDHTPMYDDPARAQWHSAYDLPATVTPCYDIAGNLLFQHSMDAGDRWMLTDAAGKPMLAWDVNDFRTDTGAGPSQNRLFHTEYDALHRPTRQWLKINGDAPSLVEAFDYCDTSTLGSSDLLDARIRNLIGQAVRHWDPSGVATVERIDLSGQPSHVSRRLIGPDRHGNADGVLDWSGDRLVLLDRDTFHQVSEHDALGRMTTLFNWHRESAPGASGRVAVYVPAYNERGLLVSEMLHVRAEKATVGDRATLVVSAQTRSAPAIRRITYNVKGQKLTLAPGNGTSTSYAYDDETFRLTSLRTVSTVPGRGFQDLKYTYDPVGNITHIRDAAQETVYRSNTVVRPEHEYVYDAIYRLIEGTGRENPNAPSPPSNQEGAWSRGAIPTADVPRNYTQRYTYDAVGNFVEMRHRPDVGTGWTLRYDTQPDSNRLNQTWYDSNTVAAVTYHHDPHGNMLNLHQVEPPPADPEDDWGRAIRWDWRDMIRMFDAIGGGIARYHYGIDKQRTRKVINRRGSSVEDRIYLGGYELYRRHRGNPDDPDEEIESHHLFEGEQRVLLVDDVLTAKASGQPGPNGLTISTQMLFRYQYGNHLGSVGLELDSSARVISYEEFHPYGTSAYRVMNSAIEVPAKRYRYTGKERDEESGLSYHSARYLAQTLGRWVSADPGGVLGGLNTYLYAEANCIRLADPAGLQAQEAGLWRGFEKPGDYVPDWSEYEFRDRGILYRGSRPGQSAEVFVNDFQKVYWEALAWRTDPWTRPPLVEATLLPPPEPHPKRKPKKPVPRVTKVDFDDDEIIGKRSGPTPEEIRDEIHKIDQTIRQLAPDLKKAIEDAKSETIGAFPLVGWVLASVYDLYRGDSGSAAQNVAEEGVMQTGEKVLEHATKKAFGEVPIVGSVIDTVKMGRALEAADVKQKQMEALRFRRYELKDTLGDPDARYDDPADPKAYLGPDHRRYDRRTGRPLPRIQGK
jgi:RHS repeat-associated protein